MALPGRSTMWRHTGNRMNRAWGLRLERVTMSAHTGFFWLYDRESEERSEAVSRTNDENEKTTD